MIAFFAVRLNIFLPGADLVEHGAGIAEDIRVVRILLLVIDPVLSRDIVLIQGNIVGLAGLIKGVIVFYYFERVEIEIE